jgi:hypothetical protein
MIVLRYLLLVTAFTATTARAQFCGTMPKSVRDAMPVSGLRVGTPVIASFYTGPSYFNHADDCNAYLQAVFEPGIGGGQAGIAYGKWQRRQGFRAQAVVLRTWGPTWRAPSGVTYGGMEFQATNGTGIRVGFFRRLSSGTAQRGIVSLGITFGQ